MSAKTLRNKIIRLAHQNPSIRKDLLPLLKEARLHDKLGGSRKASSTEQLLKAKEVSIKGHGIYVVVDVEGGDVLLRQMGGRKEYTLSVMVGGSLLGNGAELKGRGNTRMRAKFIQGKDITVIS